MNTNHTPGPWHCNGTQIVGKLGKRTQYIAETLRDTGCETCNANARLIASAPELLAALQAMLKADEDICENVGLKSDQAMQRIAALDQAHEAIARATA